MRTNTLMTFLLLAGCGGSPAASAADRCVGERAAPSISAHDALPVGTAGGAGAWVELSSSHTEPGLADNHVLLDGTPIPIVRASGGEEAEHTLDAAAGQLTPRQAKAVASKRSSHVIGFRIPASTPPGPHAITLRTCNATSAESVSFQVLPNPAPSIASIRLVRGAVWPTLFIKGANLAAAEEVVLVAADGSISNLEKPTLIDDGELRVSVEASGAYEVFIRSKNGLGGGPPNGVITVR